MRWKFTWNSKGEVCYRIFFRIDKEFIKREVDWSISNSIFSLRVFRMIPKYYKGIRSHQKLVEGKEFFLWFSIKYQWISGTIFLCSTTIGIRIHQKLVEGIHRIKHVTEHVRWSRSLKCWNKYWENPYLSRSCLKWSRRCSSSAEKSSWWWTSGYYTDLKEDFFWDGR